MATEQDIDAAARAIYGAQGRVPEDRDRLPVVPDETWDAMSGIHKARFRWQAECALRAVEPEPDPFLECDACAERCPVCGDSEKCWQDFPEAIPAGHPLAVPPVLPSSSRGGSAHG